jgi:hypothetical protein
MSGKNEKRLGMTNLYYEDSKTKSWIAFEPLENGKYRVILPARGSSVAISNVEDLLNWFNQAFPNSIDIRHCGEVTKIS